jgi:hypothetical protein
LGKNWDRGFETAEKADDAKIAMHLWDNSILVQGAQHNTSSMV